METAMTKAYVSSLQGNSACSSCRHILKNPTLTSSYGTRRRTTASVAPGARAADLLRAVVGQLRYLQKTPAVVRSLFQHPETRRAAHT